MPERIQLRRTKGWRTPEDAVVVARPSKWGNPFMGDGAIPDRAYLARLYRDYIQRPEQAALVLAIKDELRGKDLCCWCPLDQPCHGDVLLEIANA